MNLLGHTGEELPDSEKMFKSEEDKHWDDMFDQLLQRMELLTNPQTESEAEINLNLNQTEEK